MPSLVRLGLWVHGLGARGLWCEGSGFGVEEFWGFVAFQARLDQTIEGEGSGLRFEG